MIHALFQRLAAAKHHRRGSTHTQRMRGPMNINPLLCPALQPADPIPHRIVQNLRPAARNRIQPRIPQPRNGIPQRNSADLRDIRNLRSRKAMAPDIELRLDGPQQILIPFDL